jgi:mRNA interferase MazF
MVKYIPRRGDIVWLDFDPQKGREQSGRRPALVLSRESYNARSGLAIICPITSKIKNYPFEVIIPEETCSIHGAILADQIGSFDWQGRNATFADTVPMSFCERVIHLVTMLNS